ncbi:MAG: LPS export ABC transporter ATP-binding protein [Puniceicoccaceae bacterium]
MIDRDSPPPSLLSARGLTKTYGLRTVVAEVDLTINGGEVVGLLGPNGAGKTTCFYLIVGLIRARGGTIALNGEPITHLPMHRRARLGLGYLPQEASVFRKLKVKDNLLGVLQTLSIPRREQIQRSGEILEELGLCHLAEQRAYTLSGGERRRLEIARALVLRPQFLLMDEPFSGVDPRSVAEVQDIIRKLRQKGIGILITDHNVRETLEIVNRAYLLHEGRILAEGDRDFLINDPESRRLYLGENFRY